MLKTTSGWRKERASSAKAKKHTMRSAPSLQATASQLFKGPPMQCPVGKDLTIRLPPADFDHRNKTIFAAGGWVRVSDPTPIRRRRPASAPRLVQKNLAATAPIAQQLVEKQVVEKTDVLAQTAPVPVQETRVVTPPPASVPAPKLDITKEEEKEEESDDDVSKDTAQAAIELTGFHGAVSYLNGTFVPEGRQLNGKEVYSQGMECMWYHNGAWRIGVPEWANGGKDGRTDLGRCHAYVKTDEDNVAQIAPTSTWMACESKEGGDPDAEEGAGFAPQAAVFMPQLDVRAAKLALDTALLSDNGYSSHRQRLSPSTKKLTKLLVEQSERQHFEPPPLTPDKMEKEKENQKEQE